MSSSKDTARSIVRRLVAERTKVLVVVAGVLVVLGLIAVLADWYGLALACVLLLQAAIAGYLVTASGTGEQTGGTTHEAVDRASVRTLADIAHARQSILDAIAELDTRTP
jgi:flagellar biosynthesis component FlhA